MSRRVSVFAVMAALALCSSAVRSQQPAVPAATPPGPSWAFPEIEGSLPAESGPQRVAGSMKTYTHEQIDDLGSLAP
jgi:hypothetical protein